MGSPSPITLFADNIADATGWAGFSIEKQEGKDCAFKAWVLNVGASRAGEGLYMTEQNLRDSLAVSQKENNSEGRATSVALAQILEEMQKQPKPRSCPAGPAAVS